MKAPQVGWIALSILVLVALVVGYNGLQLNRPLQNALAVDSRNEVFQLRARLHYWVVPNVLVLNLSDVEGTASRADLLRGIFHAAQTFAVKDRRFERVVLARNSNPVYWLDGAGFYEMGLEFDLGQNPVYLMRTWPERLRCSDGTQAFGSWTGGLLGVVGEQMQDVNEAVEAWVGDSGC